MNFCRLPLLCLTFLMPGLLWAQDPIIYPKDGQDSVQQDKDNYECYGWAKGQSGFDPMVQPMASEPPPPQQTKKGGLLRGAAGGAIVGGIVDGSSGAKTGAAAGGVVGGMRRSSQNRSQAQEQQQWEQQQAAQYEQGRDTYNRAFSACMEGRGYTIQ